MFEAATGAAGTTGAVGAQTHVRRIGLVSFRSYGTLDVEFPGGPQVVVGDNAAGKTNLLESMVALGLGHSHRASADGELISWGADFTRVEVDLAPEATR